MVKKIFSAVRWRKKILIIHKFLLWPLLKPCWMINRIFHKKTFVDSCVHMGHAYNNQWLKREDCEVSKNNDNDDNDNDDEMMTMTMMMTRTTFR